MDEAIDFVRRVIPSNEDYFYTPQLAFAGPGGITSFVAWFGLRAYSQATIGGPILDLDNGSGSTVTISSLSGGPKKGFLDTATAAPLIASGYLVSKLYDQTGGGFHLLQTTHATRPSLNTSGRIPFLSGTSKSLDGFGGPTTTQAQPYCWAGAFDSGNTGTLVELLQTQNNSDGVEVHADDTYGLLPGAGSTSFTAVRNAYEASCALVNGASSLVLANSKSSAIVASAGSMGNAALFLQLDSATARWLEQGLLAGDQSASFTALIAQARSQWGI